MAMQKKKSLTVLISLVSKLKDSCKRDELIESITCTLIENGVCSVEEVRDREERFAQMVSDVEGKMDKGVSYNEAYKRVRTKYPEFNNLINLN